MEPCYPMRTHPWLAQWQGTPVRCDQVMPRLSTLLAPLGEPWQGQALTPPVQTSGSGLLSDVERTNGASLA
jgi:hypothetical protein